MLLDIYETLITDNRNQYNVRNIHLYALIIANNYTNSLNESKNRTQNCLNCKTKGEPVSVN